MTDQPMGRELVKQRIDRLSLVLTYPELDDLHALDEADAALRARLAEVERKYALVKDDPDYAQCCQLRERAEQQLATANEKIAALECENERLQAEMGYYEAQDVIEQLRVELVAWKHSAISATALQLEIDQVKAENERLRQWVQHLRSDACDDGSHYSGSLKLCDIYLCCDLALSGNPAPQTTATPHITTYQALLDCQQQLAAMTQERDEALGCLGYPVPADTPSGHLKCGLCEAREQQIRELIGRYGAGLGC